MRFMGGSKASIGRADTYPAIMCTQPCNSPCISTRLDLSPLMLRLLCGAEEGW